MRISQCASLGLALAGVVASQAVGSDYIVIIDKDSAHTSQLASILEQVNLHPSDPVITHVFNNSAFSGFIAKLDKSHVQSLSDMASIKTVEKSQEVKAHLTSVAGSSPWGLERISQVGKVSGDTSQLNFKYSYDTDSHLGQGVDVYVVDTGVKTDHETFGGRAVMAYSTKGQSDLNANADQDGHGTHVAGTCCGAQFGVAPRANVFGVKVLGADGSGSSSDTIKGIDFVVQNHDQRKNNPNFVGSVASMSWGLGGRSSSVEQAIKSATQAGIHVVVAAGNDGADACKSSPSAMGGTGGDAIAVGSIGSGDKLSSFSNIGQCVDVYGPGEGIISAGIASQNAVKTLSGTSMSTPHTTGIVATLLAHYTNLRNPSTMKNFIKSIAIRGAIDGAGREQNLIMLNNGQRGAGLGGSNLGGQAVTTVTIRPTVTQHVTATANPGIPTALPDSGTGGSVGGIVGGIDNGSGLTGNGNDNGNSGVVGPIGGIGGNIGGNLGGGQGGGQGAGGSYSGGGINSFLNRFLGKIPFAGGFFGKKYSGILSGRSILIRGSTLSREKLQY